MLCLITFVGQCFVLDYKLHFYKPGTDYEASAPEKKRGETVAVPTLHQHSALCSHRYEYINTFRFDSITLQFNDSFIASFLFDHSLRDFYWLDNKDLQIIKMPVSKYSYISLH